MCEYTEAAEAIRDPLVHMRSLTREADKRLREREAIAKHINESLREIDEIAPLDEGERA